MQFFDSHAHLTDDDDYYENVDGIIKRAKGANVTKIINVCSDLKSLDKGYELQKKYDFIYTAAATSAQDADNDCDTFFEDVKKSVDDKTLIAIGETGLDYFYGFEKKRFQKLFFKNYLKLAKENKLPLIIHARDSFVDLFKIADENEYSLAVLHCFTGTKKDAKSILDRGWYISFSGIVTFKSAQDLRDIVKMIPINRILVETDSPFLAPQSKRGKVNEPANVIETTQMIADIKNKSLNEMAKITFDNANRFFFG